jgi:hypothetical protein
MRPGHFLRLHGRAALNSKGTVPRPSKQWDVIDFGAGHHSWQNLNALEHLLYERGLPRAISPKLHTFAD